MNVRYVGKVEGESGDDGDVFPILTEDTAMTRGGGAVRDPTKPPYDMIRLPRDLLIFKPGYRIGSVTIMYMHTAGKALRGAGVKEERAEPK